MNKPVARSEPKQVTLIDIGGPAGALSPPLCWIIENEPSKRHFLSLILNGFGIDTLEYVGDAELSKEETLRIPDLIFLNVSHDSTDAVASILRLAKSRYRGPGQLMSSRGPAVLESVKRIGAEHGLNMLPALAKPFDTQAVTKIILELRLGPAISSSTQLDLDDAIENDWIEFWYQPVIDLRKRRLASIEAFARVRHPRHGIVLPAGFLANASNSSIVKLSELATLAVLKAGLKFSKLGLDLPMSVNMPIEALAKLPIERLVRDFHARPQNWPGLIVDVPEEQIVKNLPLVVEFLKNLQRLNVRLAIDNFGRSETPLSNVKELPFAQIKLDRLFVSGEDEKLYAARCKMMINLAQNFGSKTVAIGIERATDAMALMSMGCDYGQGHLLGQPMAQEQFVSLLRRRLGERKSRLRTSSA